MKDVLIFGLSDIAELAAFYFSQTTNRKVAAFTVDAAYASTPSKDGKPVVAWEQVETLYPPESFEVFVALSYAKLNKVRREKVAEARSKGYSLASYISPRATTFDGFDIRPNQFILEDNTIQPFAKIGENVTLWSGNHIGHHSYIAEDTFVASHVVVSGGVTIGPRCFIGVNVTIRDHVKIGADCVIGAGSLVLTDIPDGSVVAATGTEISKVPSHRLRQI